MRPVVTLEDFFEGNQDEASIGCNLVDHPGVDRFYETLRGIRDRADVQDVLVRSRRTWGRGASLRGHRLRHHDGVPADHRCRRRGPSARTRRRRSPQASARRNRATTRLPRGRSLVGLSPRDARPSSDFNRAGGSLRRATSRGTPGEPRALAHVVAGEQGRARRRGFDGGRRLRHREAAACGVGGVVNWAAQRRGGRPSLGAVLRKAFTAAGHKWVCSRLRVRALA